MGFLEDSDVPLHVLHRRAPLRRDRWPADLQPRVFTVGWRGWVPPSMPPTNRSVPGTQTSVRPTPRRPN